MADATSLPRSTQASARHFMFLERPELGSPLAEALELSRTKAGAGTWTLSI
jgi:hypothetical protein